MTLNSLRLLAMVVGTTLVAGAGLFPSDADARGGARASVARPPAARPPAARPPAARPPAAVRPPPPGVRHPIGTAVAVGTAAAVTAAVVGSMVYSLPPSCSSVRIDNVTYQQCDSTWYQPQYLGSDVQYIVVESPW